MNFTQTPIKPDAGQREILLSQKLADPCTACITFPPVAREIHSFVCIQAFMQTSERDQAEFTQGGRSKEEENCAKEIVPINVRMPRNNQACETTCFICLPSVQLHRDTPCRDHC